MAGGSAAALPRHRATTGGAFGLYRWDMGPRPSGPSPHFHRSITESFYVLSGHGSAARRAELASTRGPGDFFHVPIGGVHGFRERVGGADVDAAAVHARRAAGGLLRDAGRRRPAARPWAPDDWTAFYLRHDTFWVATDRRAPSRHSGDRLRVVGLAGAGLRVDGGAGRLAARAPPGDPLLEGRCPWSPSRIVRPAAAARAALAAGDPVVLAAPGLPGGALRRVVAVGQHQRAGPGDQRREVRGRRRPAPRGSRRTGRATRPCRGCRCRPGCAGPAGRRRSARRGGHGAGPGPRSRSQSGPSTSGPRWPTTSDPLGAGGDEADVVQPVTDALPLVGGQDRPDAVPGSAPPRPARPVDVPAAVHPVVGAQRPAVGEAGEQCACRGSPPLVTVAAGPGRRPPAAARAAHRGAASRRPRRCSSAGRPARRCLPRAGGP